MSTTTPAESLPGFLLRMLDADEATAKKAAAEVPGGDWVAKPIRDGRDWRGEPWDCHVVTEERGCVTWSTDREEDQGSVEPLAAVHIARHDPARVLREVAAKRAILAEHRHYVLDDPTVRPRYYDFGGDASCELCHDYDGMATWYGWCTTLRALAAVYSDDPDYREEWAL